MGSCVVLEAAIDNRFPERFQVLQPSGSHGQQYAHTATKNGIVTSIGFRETCCNLFRLVDPITMLEYFRQNRLYVLTIK